MRLARLVAAGLVVGGVVGFLTAFLRRRAASVVPSAVVPAPETRRPVGLAAGPAPSTDLLDVRQSGPAGAGSELPTRPFPLPIQPALTGTGGTR